MISITEPSFERLAIDDMPERDRLEHVAEEIQKVLRVAYSRVFEQQRQPRLPAGTIRRELFDETKPERVRRQIKRMGEHMNDYHSVYWLNWVDEELVGLSKTSPLKPNRKFMPRSDYYLNDIAVTDEGNGWGSALLEHALTEYPLDRRMLLDAYEGNDRANSWFNKLGFEPVSPQAADLGFQIGQVVVPQIRMAAPWVGLVAERLSRNER